ncbi:MAG: LamG domain-containing protein [Polyangiaceae bacterium]|nr:LamG domain-containing protein [Polyangiaceae bacterium]
MSKSGHLSRSLLPLAWLLLACSGEEFASEAQGSGGAATGSGGTAGTTVSGGAAGAGGAAGSPAGGGAAGTTPGGGAAGVAVGGGGGSGGGSGGAPMPPCGPFPEKSPKFYTTLDGSTAILKPSSGVGPGAGNGTFTAGKCASALSVKDTGHYLQFPALGNLDTDRGTLDFWMLPDHSPKDGKSHTFLYVAGRFNVAKGDTGSFSVGVTDSTGGTQVTHVKVDYVPYVAGAWVRVTVTWDFSRKDQHVRVYFDQAEVPKYLAVSAGAQSMEPVTGSDTLAIGARSSTSTEVAGAVLDDVKLYDAVVFP